MSTILLAMVMSILVEALVEYGKTIITAVGNKEYKTAGTQLTAIVLAVLLCFSVSADIFTALGINFAIPGLGTLLTGIFASRGSNYVSDIVKKIQSITTKTTGTTIAATATATSKPRYMGM